MQLAEAAEASANSERNVFMFDAARMVYECEVHEWLLCTMCDALYVDVDVTA